jgi:hypothetical protein
VSIDNFYFTTSNADISRLGVVCNSEFCWGCGMNWERIRLSGDRAHAPGCIMYRDRALNRWGAPSFFPEYEPGVPRAAQDMAPREAPDPPGHSPERREERPNPSRGPRVVIDLTNDSDDDL